MVLFHDQVSSATFSDASLGSCDLLMEFLCLEQLLAPIFPVIMQTTPWDRYFELLLCDPRGLLHINFAG